MSDARPVLMFVDDDQIILRAMARCLRAEASEWDLVLVDSPSAALELLAERRFDVVVSDFNMPSTRGDEVLAAAQRLQPQAGRIMLTAADITASEAHAHQVVGKPFEPVELRSLLHGLVTELQTGDIQNRS